MAFSVVFLAILFVKIATLVNFGHGENLLPDETTCGIYSPEADSLKMSEFPWNVLLKYRNENDAKEFGCTGVLINEKYVLTAAHCVIFDGIDEKTKLQSVRLGEYNLDTNPDCVEEKCADLPIDVAIESITVHEDYDIEDDHQRNDIALIKLRSKVQFNDRIKPVCLSPEKNCTGSELVMTGWNICDDHPINNTPQKSTATVKDLSFCEGLLKVELDENFLCLFHENRESANINDGGSFLYQDPENSNFYAVGINVIDDFFDELKYPHLYTRVDRYYEWIVNNMKL